MAVIFVLMKAIRRHYDRVATETALVEGEDRTLPSRVRAIVLVSEAAQADRCARSPSPRPPGRARSRR